MTAEGERPEDLAFEAYTLPRADGPVAPGTRPRTTALAPSQEGPERSRTVTTVDTRTLAGPGGPVNRRPGPAGQAVSRYTRAAVSWKSLAFSAPEYFAVSRLKEFQSTV